MFHVENLYFVDYKGQKCRVIQTELINDLDDKNNQMSSKEEYIETHIKEKINENVLYIMKDFQSFIAKNLIQFNINSGFILDIGCGQYLKVPPYINDLISCNKFTYVGLDPLNLVDKEREYLFINGKFLNLNNYISKKFDILIFSTSLDHMQDLDLVRKEIISVTHNNSIVFFWAGLHDPEVVWQQSLISIIRKLKWQDSLFSLLVNGIKLLSSLIILEFHMRIRKFKLIKNLALDSLHYHFFTEKSLFNYISKLGNILDVKKVYGTNSIFLAVRPYRFENK